MKQELNEKQLENVTGGTNKISQLGEENTMVYYCTSCGKILKKWQAGHIVGFSTSRYCPNCKAKGTLTIKTKSEYNKSFQNK